jgi:hypothetical protein
MDLIYPEKRLVSVIDSHSAHMLAKSNYPWMKADFRDFNGTMTLGRGLSANGRLPRVVFTLTSGQGALIAIDPDKRIFVLANNLGTDNALSVPIGKRLRIRLVGTHSTGNVEVEFSKGTL